MKSRKGKAARIIVILAVVYIGIVVLFESLLGYFQPQGGNTLVIETTAADGASHERVVAALESGGQLYVAANHWPRDWYRQARNNPRVRVTMGGETGVYRATPVTEEARERLREEHGLGLFFKFLTGFPPRRFLRLAPVSSSPE